ncbi:MAG: hypothetical protein AB7I35_06520 [Ramlibacter sp.]
MQRRSLLKLGAVSAALLAAAGGVLVRSRAGIDGSQLSAGGREVFRAVGRSILDGSLPTEAGARALALTGLIDRVNGLVAALPAHAQAELSQLLAVLDTAAGRLGLAGLSADWPDADEAQIQQALQTMRVSGIALRQQAYHALHDIVGGAYFSDASTWVQLGYPGPLKI